MALRLSLGDNMLGKIVDEGIKYLKNKGYDVVEVRVVLEYYDELGSPDPVIEFHVVTTMDDASKVWRGLTYHLRNVFGDDIKHYVVCVMPSSFYNCHN